MAATLFALIFAASADRILLQDLFDYGTLAESSQIKGGFGEVNNGSAGSGTAV